MRVRYVGRNNIFTTEYNGKRFCFHRGGEPIDIPLEAWRMINRSGHVDAENVVPVENSIIEPNYSLLEDKNRALAIEIKELKLENKKLTEKLSKIKEKTDAKKK